MLVYAEIRHVKVVIIFDSDLQVARKTLFLCEPFKNRRSQKALSCLRATYDGEDGAAVASLSGMGGQEEIDFCEGARRLPKSRLFQILQLVLDEVLHRGLVLSTQQLLTISLPCCVAPSSQVRHGLYAIPGL